MNEPCREFRPRIDALLDGELPPEEARGVAAHLEACGDCRSDRESRTALKQSLGRLTLPPAPRRFEMADLRPARTWRWSAAAAAILVLALVLLSLPAPLPELVAYSVQLHEDVLGGRLSPDRVDPGNLGLKVAVPGTEYMGDCRCCPRNSAPSPLIVYQKGGVALTLLIVESSPGPLPPSARRSVGGRDFFIFHAGKDNALVCPSGKICHIWVARMDEQELLKTALASDEGRRLLEGERLTIEGITCRACCSTIESRVRRVEGVKDASVDPVSMELVVSSDGGKVDLQKVIRTIEEAGFKAKTVR